MPVPAFAKHLAGTGLALAPHARPTRALFLLGHMRCGSTALANVLCAHPEISGYGESHVDHGAPAAPGRLVLNQIAAGRWKPRARYLFDKILHDRLDEGVPPGFFGGRGLFLTRAPEPAIASIVALFAALGSREYPDPATAAAYYTHRLTRLAVLWERFAPGRRLALEHATLVAEPDASLARISRFLYLDPPLVNAYCGSPARRGAGDPLAASRATAIVPCREPPRAAAPAPAELAAARAAHAAFLARTAS